MNEFNGIKIGFIITGSFCTFAKAFEQARLLREMGAELIPVMSYNAAAISTRFGTADENIKTLGDICGKEVICTIEAAEPIGPRKMADILVVAPCTGNTLAKLSLSITDTPAVMAVKSHIRNSRPVLIALATNDALAGTAKNLGNLMNMKNYFFVPLKQDDYVQKPTSLVADYELLNPALQYALSGKQIQPVMAL